MDEFELSIKEKAHCVFEDVLAMSKKGKGPWNVRALSYGHDFGVVEYLLGHHYLTEASPIVFRNGETDTFTRVPFYYLNKKVWEG